MKWLPRYAVLLLLVSVSLLVLPSDSFGLYWGKGDVPSPAHSGPLTTQAGAIAPSTSVPRVAGTLEPSEAPGSIAQPTADYAPGEIIIKFKTKPKLDESRLSDPKYLAAASGLEGITVKHKLRRMKSVFGKVDAEKAKRRFQQRAKRSHVGKTPPDLSGIYKIVLDDTNASVLDTCAELRKYPNIEFAEPNYVARIQMVPNDPYYSSSGSWGQAYDDLWGIKKINCAPAWDTSLGDGVVVAVIDTGLDYNHEDIASNVWVNSAEDINHNAKFDNWPSTEERGGVFGDLDGIDNDSNGKVDDVIGWDFCTYGGGTPDNNPMDDMGHGTHVAGTIAAVGNNGVGVIGVAPHVKIMPVRGLNYQGYGYNDDLAGCLTYAADNGADILSNSWGYRGSSNTLSLAVEYADSLGCVIVASAGNSNYDIGPTTFTTPPATLPGVIGVAATDTTDQRASFSNYGAFVDVAAPGVDILSLRAANTDLYLGSSGYTAGQNFVPAFDPNAKYYRANGTSMACPHISGVAALVLAAHPTWTKTQVERAIENSAEVPVAWDKYLGTGRANAGSALQVVSMTDARVEITYPTENVYLFEGTEITGTAMGASYVVELGQGLYPSSWTQIGSGGPVTDAVLATFHGAGVADGFYNVRLRSEDATATVRCYYDALLRKGFPHRAVHSSPSSIVISDLEDDGEQEIVSTSIIGIDVVKWDGSEADGYPVRTVSGYGNSWLSINVSPAVGDIIGSDEKEIVILGYDTEYSGRPHMQTQAFSKGNMLWRFDAVDEWSSYGIPPMLVDRDGDGKNEIVVTSYGDTGTAKEGKQFVYMLSGDGGMLWRTTPSFPKGWLSDGALGDINGDGVEEIVLTANIDANGDGSTDDAKIVVLDMLGNVLAQMAPADHGIASGALRLADVNADGKAEIVYAPWTYPVGGRVYAFNGEGDQLWASQQVEGTIFSISPGDLNADGSPELVVRCYNGLDSQSYSKIYILSATGTILNHWTDARRGWVSLSEPPTAAIADVDGNGSPDIVTSGFIWDAAGSPLPSRLAYGEVWTAYTYWGCNPALAQLSASGSMDLCGNTIAAKVNPSNLSDVFAWQLPVAYSKEHLEWPMAAHDARNSNCYVSPSVPPATPTFSPDGGTYPSAQSVIVSCATAGAKIRYTTDGTDPIFSSALVRSGASVLVDRTMTLKARAWTYDWLYSDVKSAVYTIDAVCDPVFAPNGGTYGSPQSVTISCSTQGAVIHYTTNGVDPTELDPVVSGPIQVSSSLSLKAKAWKEALMPSGVKSADYTVRTPIKVKNNAPGPVHDGQTWATAFLAVQQGIDAAVPGGEVWVAAGTYTGCITLKAGVALYGGFTGIETNRSQRNWGTNVTILDGNQAGSVVTAPPGATTSTIIDGFTIRNGNGTLVGSDRCGGGVYCSSSSPNISNNIITANGASTAVANGAGIYCSDSSPTIANNTISSNTANSWAGGIFCSNSSPVITGNTISGNKREGISCLTSSCPLIAGNIIKGNIGSGSGGGISSYSSSRPTIVNNTIVANTDPYAGGIYCSSSNPTIANNIVAFNSSGIYSSACSPGLSNNCFYANTSYDYRSVAPGVGDISVDPKFVNRTGGDLHLLPTSPCVDVGDDSWVEPTWLDIDGQQRIQGAHVEIGADEVSTVSTPTFSPEGGTYASAQSVVVTCATQGAAVHYTINGIDPTESDPTVVSGGVVQVSASLVLKAKAWKTSCVPSQVKTAEYLIDGSIGTLPAPEFGPPGGVYTSSQYVAIKCASAAAVIRYTTDGSQPTAESTLYTAPVLVNTSGTLKAKAWKDGWNESAVGSAAYTVVNRLYVKKNAPGPAHDGLSWATAFLTVKEALTFASPGNELWVAAATYYERIAVKEGVALYGGFSGTETAMDQRNWSASVTILDGNYYQGPVVMMPYGATSTTRIDGFTVRNGGSSDAGLVHCDGSSPIIANNIITTGTGAANAGIYVINCSPSVVGNVIAGNSNGLICQGQSPASAPIISNNLIQGNKYQGIRINGYMSPAISNNAIIGNSDCGIDVTVWSNPTIANNTIVANAGIYGGAGIKVDSTCSPSIVNNLVAYNSAGISKDSSAAAALRNNNSYGNTAYNYSGWSVDPATMNNNLSVDPKLAGYLYGNVHIQPDSPCVDAGQDSVVDEGSLDMDAQARMQGSHVDIGADESDGTTWNVAPKIVRVSTNGNDANDGSTWTLAKKTVQAGIDAAAVVGGEVWVKHGTYNEHVTLRSFVYVYGGFAGSEANRSQRDWRTNATILDGGGSSSVVTASQAGYLLGAIDGFTIRNGLGYYGCGVYCDSTATVIANNTITSNGGTLYGGVYCYSSPSVITSNKIVQNSTSNNGGGIWCYGSPPTITNNVIALNTASRGGGIYCNYSSPVILSNTISGNTAASGGGGIHLISSSAPTVANNIIAFGNSGVYKDSGSTPVLRNNDLFGNTSYNYSGLSAGTGDISTDPLFVNKNGGNYRLVPTSPCINAGWNGAWGLPSMDMDGQNRILGGVVDIGADEYLPSGDLTSIPGAKRAAANSWIETTGNIVTARLGDAFYIETENRSSGIRIEKPGHTLDRPMKAHVFGKVKTNADGEVYVEADLAEQKGSETGVVDPLSLPNRSLGGGPFGLQGGITEAFGLNNIGLLVRTWGRVVGVEPVTPPAMPTWIEIDDGSNVSVKCLAPAGVTINPSWTYLVVTGISSCENIGGELHRLLRVRTQDDITPY